MRRFFLILAIILFQLTNLFSSEKNGVINYWHTFSKGRFSSFTIEQVRKDGLNYLNQLRYNAGLWEFTENSQLDESAQNHAKYLIANNTITHIETEGLIGFTGETPGDRAIYTGYSTNFIVENLSVGDENVRESIDNLFSAIYHRLGFLNLKIDEIGIGYSYSNDSYYKTFYVYNMGNSFLRKLCSSSNTYNGTGYYYTNICSDSAKKISKELYDNVTDYFYEKAHKYIVWPYNGYYETPPVFYEEIPDPLPECSVSGYPISIQFNPYKIDRESFKLLSFKLYSNGDIVDNVKLLDSQNDPNQDIGSYEYALMPLERFQWNKNYQAEVVYFENGETHKIEWSFHTKSLNAPYFILTNNYAKINIKPNKTYYLYFKPSNCNDSFTSMQYQTDVSKINLSFYDGNTLKLYAEGNLGNKIFISLNNGKSVEIQLASYESDSLVTPQNNYCGYINGATLFLPCVIVGENAYSVNFQYLTNLDFKLTEIKKLDNWDSNSCGTYNIQTAQLYYPCIDINSKKIWATFKYTGENLIFQVTDYEK